MNGGGVTNPLLLPHIFGGPMVQAATKVRQIKEEKDNG